MDEWLVVLTPTRDRTAHRRLVEEQDRAGSRHTVREIAQQPATWMETAARVARPTRRRRSRDRGRRGRGGSIVLTGSGSSLYAGECLAPALQAALRLPVHAVSAGELLIHPAACLPPSGPCLLVSFGRSGNSPESCGAIDVGARARPGRHLVITCNGRAPWPAATATTRASPASCSTTRPTTAAW